MRAELSEQIQRFEEKYAENPDSLVFARLADLYRKAGDADRALALLEEGLERHPDYLSALIVRARCLRDLGRTEEAEQAFDGVLEHDEQNLVALRELAEMARERGAPDEAERRYEKLLALDPHNEEARAALEELVEGEAAGADGGPSEDRYARAELEEEAGEASPSDEGESAGPGAAPEPPEEGEGPGPDPADADAEDGGPWWRTGEPDHTGGPTGPGEADDTPGPEEPGVPDETAEPAGTEEAAPAGADQEGDVFSLAGPEEEVGDASPEDETGPAPGEEEAVRPPEAPGPASREEAEFLGLDEGGGSAGASPEDAVDGGLPAEEELTERIEEIADTGEGASPEIDGEEDLLTETLADLYETQGFYREAVEMYEELLEERPDDEELRDRLEAARSAMGEAGPEDGADESDGTPAGPAAVDAVSGGAEDRPSRGGDDRAGGAVDDATSDDEATTGRKRASARTHLQALLRGEADEDGDASSEGPDPAP